MKHIPIATFNSRHIDFSHFIFDANAGHWQKQRDIYSPYIKINVFVEGNFTLFTRSGIYHPVFGDVCIFSPMELHRANVAHPMHIDYYQIDLSPDVLSFIDNNGKLIERLTSDVSKRYFRPHKEDQDSVFALLRKIEEAINTDNKPLALAHMLELLCFIADIRQNSSSSSVTELSRLTRSVIETVEKEYGNALTLDALASRFSVSPSYLSRVFKKECGMGIHEYLTERRILKACEMLERLSVTEVCYTCGFSDCSHFISVFKKRMGITPKMYKNLHQGRF